MSWIRHASLGAVALFTAVLTACSAPQDKTVGPGDEAKQSQSREEPVDGRMGGAGIRSQKANLYFNTDSVDEHIGTRDGEFSQFRVECWSDKVVISAGDGASAKFTVGSQKVVFLLDDEEFATVTADDEVEWGAGSSFQVEMLQEILDNDHRVTFSGSADCP